MDNRNIEVGGKTYIKSKVVMLATEKTNNSIVKDKNGNLYTNIANIDLGQGHQHLYFLSDEEIKKGDWVFSDMKDYYNIHYIVNQDGVNATKHPQFKKIIATTDESLAVDGEVNFPYKTFKNLPRPSNEFLQAYCKRNGNIEEVLVEVERAKYPDLHNEELLLKVSPDNTITIKKVEEKMYKEYDMFLNMQYYMEHCQREGYCTPQKWMSDFKHF